MNQLIWFRDDLRIHDNTALTNAISKAKKQHSKCHAIYYWSENQLRSHGTGDRKFSAIQTALNELNSSLAKIGIELTLVSVNSWYDIADDLKIFCESRQISDLHFHLQPAVNEEKRDTMVRSALFGHVTVSTYNDLNLIDPYQHTNLQGDYFKVFTAYKKSLLKRLDNEVSPPLPAPTFNQAITESTLHFQSEYYWENPLKLPITETDAHDRLDAYLLEEPSYEQTRDIPSIRGTSRLSVALSLGTISSKQIMFDLINLGRSVHQSTYFSEIIWRDYYKYLLIHRPELSYGQPFNKKWDKFPWVDHKSKINAWKNGETGVPIVDAGMRQLNTNGWMHNRLRMITAMYLTKILQVNWRLGELYFAEQLADFDFAANNGGWQWVASTGVDATPYFRIFNPYLQSKKFDPHARFIRKYVPELAKLEAPKTHEPSAQHHIESGYAQPNVDYKQAREDTLFKFKSIKE